MTEHGLTPRLSVVLVGDNPAARVYVRNKDAACREAGMASEIVALPASVSRQTLLATIAGLNRDERVHGILVQLPLPEHLDAHEAMAALDPAKDVDGLHPESVGKLMAGQPGFVPCTPAGIVELLVRHDVPLSGAEAVVIGRSDIVGKPVAMLLLRKDSTVTLCHSRTRDLPAVARRADILIAAIGRAAFVTAEFIKPGAVVVDVGINRCTSTEEAVRFWPGDGGRLEEIRAKGWTLVGDVHPAQARETASALTPVPGGIGPMTIAMLLANTLRAARLAAGMGDAGSAKMAGGAEGDRGAGSDGAKGSAGAGGSDGGKARACGNSVGAGGSADAGNRADAGDNVGACGNSAGEGGKARAAGNSAGDDGSASAGGESAGSDGSESAGGNRAGAGGSAGAAGNSAGEGGKARAAANSAGDDGSASACGESAGAGSDGSKSAGGKGRAGAGGRARAAATRGLPAGAADAQGGPRVQGAGAPEAAS